MCTRICTRYGGLVPQNVIMVGKNYNCQIYLQTQSRKIVFFYWQYLRSVFSFLYICFLATILPPHALEFWSQLHYTNLPILRQGNNVIIRVRLVAHINTIV